MCIAALYACLIRRLSRLDREGALPAEPPTEIINENRWLAQRYGILAFLGDTSEGGRKDIEDSAAELVEELADDARALGCEQELRHTLTIIRQGAGADRQIDLFPPPAGGGRHRPSGAARRGGPGDRGDKGGDRGRGT